MPFLSTSFGTLTYIRGGRGSGRGSGRAAPGGLRTRRRDKDISLASEKGPYTQTRQTLRQRTWATALALALATFRGKTQVGKVTPAELAAWARAWAKAEALAPAAWAWAVADATAEFTWPQHWPAASAMAWAVACAAAPEGPPLASLVSW